MQTSPDIPLLITSDVSSSERRISPAWTVAHLKTKLEPVTGIPPRSQTLRLRLSAGDGDGGGGGDGDGGGGAGGVVMGGPGVDEEVVLVGSWRLVPYAEIHVIDTRPPWQRPNFTDTSSVPKYVMPETQYAQKTDSVLAWKKAQKLGRFDPNAPSLVAAKQAAAHAEIVDRGIKAGKRCRVGGEDTRRGTVMYVGEIPEIPAGGLWVGVQLDEPVGKNDGSVGGKRYWGTETGAKGGTRMDGVFVRAERVEVGDWPVLDDLKDLEDMEEI